MRLADGKIKRAIYSKRLNRFVVECILDGKTVKAYLPNPGRLWELLLPGRPLLLSENIVDTQNIYSKPRLLFTVLAAEKKGIPILLHTHLANPIAEWIIREKFIADLEDYQIARKEAKSDGNRYDFLLENGNRKVFLEVKTCTLFGNFLAMFPDAVTYRGRKHLLGLYDLAYKGSDGAVLFLIQWPNAQFFMPDYHTDLAFARTLLKVKERILIKAVAVKLHEDLTIDRKIKELKIPWELIEKEAQDRGSYIAILYVDRDKSLVVGRLGKLFFQKGYYLYVGSAKRGLTKRMERHRKKEGKSFWHIDTLKAAAHFCSVLPFRSSTDLECRLASQLAALSDRKIPQFGCSDCSCESHLFLMKQNPIHSPDFIHLVMHYRIRRLEKIIIPNAGR